MTIVSPAASRRQFLIGSAAVAATAPLATPALAAQAPVWSNFWGFAIRGYDPVAYFDERRPVEGSEAHELEWNEAKWRFASAENMARFSADTDRYAPQYGGYCAWAMARGYFASVVPEAWDIVDEKLYLNFSLGVQAMWREDIAGYIRQADDRWPEILNS